MEQLKQTPFAAAYPAGVIEWIDVFGYAVPVTWGNPFAEYDAIRNKAAAMEFSMLLKWDIEGPGAMRVADSVFSRDISRMKPGSITYGAVLNENGTMADDCTVFAHSADHVRIFGGNPKVSEILDRYRPENVSVTQRRDQLAQLSVQGPASRKILQKLTGTSISNSDLPYYRFLTDVVMAGLSVQVSRIGFTGELGYEIVLPVQKADEFWNALFEAGKHLGLLPAGAAAVMMCRIESGMIMADFEYDDSMSPYECRMGWAVDLNKKRFHGKQALTCAKDKAKFTVVSVVLSDEGEYDGVSLWVEGTKVGFITMAIPSPHLNGRILGLARVERAYSGIDTELDLGAGHSAKAKIVPMPVYDPRRTRVRS